MNWTYAQGNHVNKYSYNYKIPSYYVENGKNINRLAQDKSWTWKKWISYSTRCACRWYMLYLSPTHDVKARDFRNLARLIPLYSTPLSVVPMLRSGMPFSFLYCARTKHHEVLLLSFFLGLNKKEKMKKIMKLLYSKAACLLKIVFCYPQVLYCPSFYILGHSSPNLASLPKWQVYYNRRKKLISH